MDDNFVYMDTSNILFLVFPIQYHILVTQVLRTSRWIMVVDMLILLYDVRKEKISSNMINLTDPDCFSSDYNLNQFSFIHGAIE